MKRRLAVLVALFGLVLPSVALAGPATDLVKAKQTTLFDLLKQSSSGAVDQKVNAIFDEMLDYAAFSEASLGSEWAARTDAERAEFGDLLVKLIQRAYQKNLRKTLDFNIAYVSETPSGTAVTVNTKATSKADASAEPIEISYKLLEKDGKWRVQDITTEGVSLVSSYRSQFTKIIKKDGFPTLIQKMKNKLAKTDD